MILPLRPSFLRELIQRWFLSRRGGASAEFLAPALSCAWAFAVFYRRPLIDVTSEVRSRVDKFYRPVLKTSIALCDSLDSLGLLLPANRKASEIGKSESLTVLPPNAWTKK